MTAVQQSTLDLVEGWRQALIPEWRVTVRQQWDGADDYDEEPLGQACVLDDHQQGRIFISPSEAHNDPAELENTVIHEILHLLLSPLTQHLSELIAMQSTDRAGVERGRLRTSEEQIVDRLAYALAGEPMFETVSE